MDNNDFEARSKSGNIALFGIICITVLFFILTRGGANTQLVNFLALTPGTLRDFQLWRLVTSLLVNYDPGNLFFAMFTLYIFGNLSTPVLGPHKTICLYLFSGDRKPSAAGFRLAVSGYPHSGMLRRGHGSSHGVCDDPAEHADVSSVHSVSDQNQNDGDCVLRLLPPVYSDVGLFRDDCRRFSRRLSFHETVCPEACQMGAA